MYNITICHLYPDLLNLYGDRGNIIALKQRCVWRNIDVKVLDISINDDLDINECDILFIGGGQDFEQEIIQADLKDNKYPMLKSYIENNGVLLAICGGYQILGKYYKTGDERLIEMLDIIDIKTIGSNERLIGNLIFNWSYKENSDSYNIVGFENHSGKTYLGDNVEPLGKVIKGFGNNGEDGYEGARYKNTFCSYSHGSLLPKNPILADFIIKQALKNKYPNAKLKELDDEYEYLANETMYDRLIK